MANWSKGPYKPGQLAFTGEECLSMFLRDNVTERWLEEQGALIAQDRLLEDDIPPEAVLEIYNTFTKTRSAFALWLQRLIALETRMPMDGHHVFHYVWRLILCVFATQFSCAFSPVISLLFPMPKREVMYRNSC